MSQKFSHTKETLVKGAIHSRKSRCQIKNGNGCTGVKSGFHRKNPQRPGKNLNVFRKLLLKLGAFKPDRSYHTKVNYRNIIRTGILGINSTRSTDRFFCLT